ncbi:MAG TPA: hypothetical protein VGB42_10015, partial [Candidatus Thermoplasmatota archaeon]
MGPTASGARRGAGAAAEAIARALVDDFDWRTYEFASAPGAAHPRALRFLLAAGLRLGTPHAAKAAVLGLDALVNSEAYDSVDGGFFVACDGPGWKDPQTGKPLALNAELVVALSLAAVETGREGFARAARETVGWFDRALSRADDDLWAPGLAADPEYYALLAHGRARRGAPAAVEGMESRASALAVSALAAAGAAGEDRALYRA